MSILCFQRWGRLHWWIYEVLFYRAVRLALQAPKRDFSGWLAMGQTSWGELSWQ